MKSLVRSLLLRVVATLLAGLLAGLLFTACVPATKDQPIPYRQEDHGTFDEEFSPHLGVNGWWFINGFLKDVNDPSHIYTYLWSQYDFRDYLGTQFYRVHLTLVDVKTGEVWFQEVDKPIGNSAYGNNTEVVFTTLSKLTRNSGSFDLAVKIPEAKAGYDLHLAYDPADGGKGPVWHGDNGVFTMGVPSDPLARTVYYSYTNMPTSGELTLPNGSTVEVTGQSWFERQWGPFMEISNINYWTYEWASIRFFDNEEIMLFSWPQHDFAEGTYVHQDGSAQRIFDLSYVPYEYAEIDVGYKYAAGLPIFGGYEYPGHNLICFGNKWELNIPGIKDGHYRLIPYVQPPYTQGGFLEIGGYVVNDANDVVGQAFLEAIPLVRRGSCPSS